MSESLYNLVKTLNKTEKIRFTESLRQTKRVKYYKKLLSIYGAAKSYSIDLDCRVFKKAEKKLIYDCKTHFKDSLNSFLITSSRYSSRQESIRKNFEIGCMLMERFLYKDAKKLLTRSYIQAKESSEMLMALMISERLMYLEKHEDITKYRVDLENIKFRHETHMNDIKKYMEYRNEFHELWIYLGLFYEKEGFKVYNRAQKKPNPESNFKLEFVKAEKEYYASIANDDVELRYEALKNILNTIYNNKDQVVKNTNIKRNYYSHLAAYVELCIHLRKDDNIKFALSEFDFYSIDNNREYNDSFKYKLASLCNYAIMVNKPELIIELESEFLSRKIVKKDFLATQCYVYLLKVNFLAKNWEKCTEYIKRLEKHNLVFRQQTVKQLSKIIIAIEREDFVYAHSLLSTYNYSSIPQNVKFVIKNCIICLKYLAENKLSNFKKATDKLLSVFPERFDFYSVFITYLAAKAELLETASYQNYKEIHLLE